MTEADFPQSLIRSRKTLLCVCILFSLLVAFYLPCLCGFGSFFYTDITFGLEPICRYLRQCVSQGHLPLWNPFEYCGMPQIAIPFPSLFYFADYIFALAPINLALSTSMIFHQMLAFFGMYAMLLSWQLRRPSAVIGASVYGFSGYMFCLPANYSLVAGAAWLPLCVFAISTFSVSNMRANFKMLLLAGFVIAQMILSGRPEVFVPGLIVILSYAALLIIRDFRKFGSSKSSQISVWIFRSVFLAFVLCMPSLLATGEWLSMSRRAAGMLSEEVFIYSANWYDFLSMFIGQSLGNMHLNTAGFRPLVSEHNFPPFVSCAYVGPVTLGLAIWGAFRRWEFRFFVIAILVIAVIGALGKNCPLTVWAVEHVPGLSFVRIPVKLLFLVTWSLSILAAEGFEGWTKRTNSIRSALIFWSVFAATAVGLLSCSLQNHCLLPFLNGESVSSSLSVKAQYMISVSTCITAVVGFILIVLSSVENQLIQRAKFFIIFSSIVATLFCNAWANERLFASAQYFETPSFVADVISSRGDKGKRVLNLCLERMTIPRGYLIGGAAEATFASYQYDRELLKPNTNIDFLVPSSFGFEGSMKGDYYYLLLHCYLNSSQSTDRKVLGGSDLPLYRFCTLTSTEYIVTQLYRNVLHGSTTAVSVLDGQLFEILAESPEKNVRVYTVRGLHPHCYVAESYKVLSDKNVLFKQILDTNPNTFDPVSNPVLEIPIELKCNSDTVHEITDVSELDSDRVLVRVSQEKPGLLVLTDQNYPGWEAFVDGSPTRIFSVNGFMRSIVVPAGNHEVKFAYNPKSTLLGWGIVVLGAAPLLFLWMRSLRRDQ